MMAVSNMKNGFRGVGETAFQVSPADKVLRWGPCDACGVSADRCLGRMTVDDDACCDECYHREAVG